MLSTNTFCRPPGIALWSLGIARATARVTSLTTSLPMLLECWVRYRCNQPKPIRKCPVFSGGSKPIQTTTNHSFLVSMIAWTEMRRKSNLQCTGVGVPSSPLWNYPLFCQNCHFMKNYGDICQVLNKTSQNFIVKTLQKSFFWKTPSIQVKYSRQVLDPNWPKFTARTTAVSRNFRGNPMAVWKQKAPCDVVQFHKPQFQKGSQGAMSIFYHKERCSKLPSPSGRGDA